MLHDLTLNPLVGRFGYLAATRRWRRARRGKGAMFSPSEADLHQLSEHFYYELLMTFEAASLLATLPGQPATLPELVMRNALLEAVIIHVRQLVDFFWGERSLKWKLTQHGAFAADYFDPGEWKRLRPQRPQTLGREMTRKVGWGVAHLTYPRAHVTPQQKEWKPLHMCAGLMPAARTFLSEVDPAKFDATWFAEMEPILDRFDTNYGSVLA